MTTCCPTCPHAVSCGDINEAVFARPEEVCDE